MKIVRNTNRWLRKLSRAAALMSLAIGVQSASAQDGPFTFGRTPSGSASEVVDSNRDGFGMSFRGGHMAGDTVGRSDSITHINLMPYININDGLLFGDARLSRANRGGLAWTFGGGYRHYITDWDVVLGANGYFDADQLTGARFQQWGLGAELLAHGWEARGNVYQTFGDTFSLVGQSINQNSVAFTGENISFTRVDAFAEALKGFDAEAGILLPGDLAERFDVRAFGGGYYYEGANAPGFAGWSSRLQTDIGQWLDLGLKLTHDQRYDTTLMFTAAVQIGGFSSQEHTKKSAIQRFRDPVRRNMNIVSLDSNIDAPGQIARKSDGTAFTVAHVNSNGTGPLFNGSVNDPFAQLTQGLSSGKDIVFVHAGSQFNAAPQNIVSLLPSQKLIGEGLISPGRNVETQIPLNLLGQTFQLTLPDSPTFAANPSLTRPILSGALGNGVTMNDNSQLSGFVISNTTQNGIFSNGKKNVFINDVSVVNAGLSGILLQNTQGTTNITNTSIDATTSGAAALHVDGGNGQINYTSNDKFLLSSIRNSSPNESLLIENMTGGRFTMNLSSIVDTGGKGVVIRNNTGGGATIDNVSVSNSSSTGIAILNSTGDYLFRKTNSSLANLFIDNPALQGILVDNASGTVTFSDPVLVQGRQTGGIEVRNSSGNVKFSKRVEVRGHAGAGTQAGIFVHDQLAGGIVNFAENVVLSASTAGAQPGSNGIGINVFNNAVGSLFEVRGNLTVDRTAQTAIQVASNSGTAQFLGATIISNRTQRGILVNASSGTTIFGTASADRTEVQNQLNSQFAAIDVTANPGNVSFSNVVVDNAQGNLPGGAGLNLVGNTGVVGFTDMDITSVGGTGIFGLNNKEINISDGIVDSTTATAIDIEESGIKIQLATVNSTGAPDYGIRLVETNKPQRHTFIVKPTVTNPTPGSGGIITGAKGNGLDDNDAAGIFLQNAGQVAIADMTLDDNEFGVRIINTETPAAKVLDNDEQFFQIVDSQVLNNDIRGIHAQNLMTLHADNVEFDNNGDSVANGRETILLSYSTTPDFDPTITGAVAPTTYANSSRPFEVLIQNSSFVSNANDVIRIQQPNGVTTGQGAVIRTQFLSNTFQINDTTDPTTVDANDTRPSFDDGFIMDWFGAARVIFNNNRMDLTSTGDQQHAFDLTQRSTLAQTDLSFQSNVINAANIGNDNGVFMADIYGVAQIGDATGTYQIASNTIDMGGVTPAAYWLSLRQVSNVIFQSNGTTSNSDGGIGFDIRRAVNNSAFVFNANTVAFADSGASQETGILFEQISGVVALAGTQNRMQITNNAIGGNNRIENPFSIPANASVGTVEINGVLFP